jgi:predicted nucleic acid-binding protein
MKLFFDTSALIKRYIDETGSQYVDRLFFETDEIFVAPITEIECISTIKRLRVEHQIKANDYNHLMKEIREDFSYFSVIEFSEHLVEVSIRLIEKYQLKTLDSIQLSSALKVKDQIENFIVSDNKLKATAHREQFSIIDPVDARF